MWFCDLAISYLLNLSIDESSLLHDKAIAFLKTRQQFNNLAQSVGIPIRSRSSKEETFSNTSLLWEDSDINTDFDWFNQVCAIPYGIDLSKYDIISSYDLVPK
jgi:hypothetical protein